METATEENESPALIEFFWHNSALTGVHAYVLPVLTKWLKDFKGKKLLDLGCGNGALTARLSALGLTVTGCDFSDSGIKIAQSSFPGVEFFRSGMEEELPAQQRNCYDLVTSIEVIEHLLLPRQLFQRAKEALKPGGTLIISTPYHGYFKNIALAVFNKYDKHFHPLNDYGHIKFFSVDTLSKLLTEQGFEIEEVKRAGRIPILACSMVIRARLKS